MIDGSASKNKIDELDADQQQVVRNLIDVFRGESTKHHIAICGPFGVGKSSIINVFENELMQGHRLNLKNQSDSKYCASYCHL